MTFEELQALKPGDKVRNAQGHEADVVLVDKPGVAVRWNEGGPLWWLLYAGRTWVQMEAVPAPERVKCDTCGTEFTVSGGAPCPTCEQA